MQGPQWIIPFSRYLVNTQVPPGKQRTAFLFKLENRNDVRNLFSFMVSWQNSPSPINNQYLCVTKQTGKVNRTITTNDLERDLSRKTVRKVESECADDLSSSWRMSHPVSSAPSLVYFTSQTAGYMKLTNTSWNKQFSQEQQKVCHLVQDSNPAVEADRSEWRRTADTRGWRSGWRTLTESGEIAQRAQTSKYTRRLVMADAQLLQCFTN